MPDITTLTPPSAQPHFPLPSSSESLSSSPSASPPTSPRTSTSTSPTTATFSNTQLPNPSSHTPPRRRRRTVEHNTNNPFRNSFCSLDADANNIESRSRLSVLSQFPTAAAKKKIAQAIASLSSGPKEHHHHQQNENMPRDPTRLGPRGDPTNRHSYAGAPIGGGITGIPSHAASMRTSLDGAVAPPRLPRRRSNSWHAVTDTSACGYASVAAEKPLAVTSGGSVSIAIALAEPVLFLQGFDQSDPNTRTTPAMLRGSLVVKVTKPTKMKAINLTFRGRARTEWPEGIPPKKNEFFEEEDIMTHVWTFFNLSMNLEGHGAHCARLDPLYSPANRRSFSGAQFSALSVAPTSSNPLGAASERRLSLQSNHSKSFSREETFASGSSKSDAKQGYRLFVPGEYIYNFELPLESCLPETMAVDLGSVKYELEATVERSGAFRPKLSGKKEVILIRCPAEGSLECTEPIAINRNWDDQLQYDIVISGKSFPLGSTIPIAFRLTPLAKVRCHRIRIYVTENIEYFCKNKKVHRLDPVRKIQLFEKRADGPTTSAFKGSTVRILAGGGYTAADNNSPDPRPDSTDNLLGNLNGVNVGPTEMEFNVQLPGCNVKEKDKIHFDTTYKNIQVHHWIKIVMRLSKADPTDPSKRRHFEISIDSPLQLLSCRATHANTSLPAYSALDAPMPAIGAPCTCPPPPTKHKSHIRDNVNSIPTQLNPSGAPTRLSTALSSQGYDPSRHSTSSSGSSTIIPSHIHRPIHLIRYPSTNPPPFDEDVPPPPPPPLQPNGSVASRSSSITFVSSPSQSSSTLFTNTSNPTSRTSSSSLPHSYSTSARASSSTSTLTTSTRSNSNTSSLRPRPHSSVLPNSINLSGALGVGGVGEEDQVFLSPPPKYESIVSGCAEPMQDYFARLAGEEGSQRGATEGGEGREVRV